MKTLKASLAAAAGLIVLTATLTLTDSGKAAAQPMKSLLVHVTNTTAEAVPVRTVLPAADRVQLEYRGGSGEPCPSFASTGHPSSAGRHDGPGFCRPSWPDPDPH